MGNLPAYSTTAFLPRCLWERPPAPPPPGRRRASVSRSLRLQVSALERCGGRLQGARGAWAWARLVVAGRGGTTAHGSAQTPHARRRGDDATGRGLRGVGLVERDYLWATAGGCNGRWDGRELEMPQDTRDH